MSENNYINVNENEYLEYCIKDNKKIKNIKCHKND